MCSIVYWALGDTHGWSFGYEEIIDGPVAMKKGYSKVINKFLLTKGRGGASLGSVSCKRIRCHNMGCEEAHQWWKLLTSNCHHMSTQNDKRTKNHILTSLKYTMPRERRKPEHATQRIELSKDYVSWLLKFLSLVTEVIYFH